MPGSIALPKSQGCPQYRGVGFSPVLFQAHASICLQAVTRCLSQYGREPTASQKLLDALCAMYEGKKKKTTPAI